MRVVIDTNVIISSFFGGNPAKILALLDSGVIHLCASQEIIDEYFEILERMKRTHEEIEKFGSYLLNADTIDHISYTPKLSVVKEDPDDDKFIECAVSLNAEYIITGDKALRAIGEYENIKIVTPKEFLNTIDEQ
ncbi:MAG TPA: putative toxin-antitoxin system toxin component, PIN family [Candidatus Kapabacteria bacterium]